jgi:branched-chain amino acid transport system ATP-binding protein
MGEHADIILQCNKITKLFGKIQAINSISFNVKQGEVYGIAGPTGSGKTTLFNLISGLFKYEGDIFFEDQRISKLVPHQICRLGITRTLQTPHLFDSLSVKDNVRIGCLFGSVDGARNDHRTDEVLDFLNLVEKRDVRAAEISLWDKKMTMLAATLATQPKLLMLDEPIAGLNQREADLTAQIIKRINQEMNVTILVIEHFMKFLTTVSDRLMILENGRKLCCDEPRKVVDNEAVIECYLGRAHA